MENKIIVSLKRWFPLIWIILTAVIFGIILGNTDSVEIFRPDWSEKGWVLFVEIFKVPLSFFAVGIPVYGIIVTLFRSLQFDNNLNRLEKQGFENTFFNFLRIHQDITNAIDLSSGSRNHPPITGRDCFEEFYSRFRNEYSGNVEAQNEAGLKRIQIAFSKCYENTQADLGHYFNHLFNMINFVDESEHSDKNFYVNIVKSQLSTFELALLFYYGLSEINKLAKGLIENYSLLENVPFDELIVDKHLNFYKKIAFEKNQI